MPFIIDQRCPCCRAGVWHCEDCWNKFHNGLKDKDFIPPKHPNQPLVDPEIMEKAREEFKKAEEEYAEKHPRRYNWRYP